MQRGLRETARENKYDTSRSANRYPNPRFSEDKDRHTPTNVSCPLTTASEAKMQGTMSTWTGPGVAGAVGATVGATEGATVGGAVGPVTGGAVTGGAVGPATG